VPVQSETILKFKQINQLPYRALLYELRDKVGNTGQASNVVPNWFGVAIPNPDIFDLSKNVFVVVYFHPTPGQAGYDNRDYAAKDGAHGTDWKQLYAYVDRLGGQFVGSIQAGARANNRLVIFPFLTTPPRGAFQTPPTQPAYTLTTSEWFNVIHDILQDINTNVVKGICTTPKKIIVATLSNGSVYLNKFLDDAAGLPNNHQIIEAWDFDSEISRPRKDVDPHGKRLRAYWQREVPPTSANATYIHLPIENWLNDAFPKFPNPPPPEVPPLPPLASHSPGSPDTTDSDRVHHYIRDTMFLDAGFNIEADNPSI
jgi:hypothetical protein